MQNVIPGIIMIIAALVLVTYIINRSRCTLEQAVQLSGCPEQELRELIQEGLLTYRHKYTLFGPLSLDTHEIAEARTAYEEIKSIRAEIGTTLRKMAEDAAARIQEAKRIYQEQLNAHKEEMERIRRVYNEVLRSLNIHCIPPHVADALRTLGLQNSASFDDVRQRYRLLAKHYHPDTGGNAEQFIQIHAAYTSVIEWIESQA